MITFGRRKKNLGFSLIEVIISVAVIATVVVSLFELLNQSLASSSYNARKLQATFKAQEAIEVIRAIRDTNINKGLTPWDKNFYVDGHDLYSINSYAEEEGWTLQKWPSETQETIEVIEIENKKFSRTIMITKFEGSDDKRMVVVRVTWDNIKSTEKVELVSVITKWK